MNSAFGSDNDNLNQILRQEMFGTGGEMNGTGGF